MTNLPGDLPTNGIYFKDLSNGYQVAIVKEGSATNANTINVHAGNATWGLSIGIEPLGFVIIGGIIVAALFAGWILWRGRKST